MATSGCFCTSPDWRNLMYEGRILAETGAPLGSALVALSEDRGAPGTRTFRVFIQGAVVSEPGPLGGHVLSVRLLGVADTVLRSYEAPWLGYPGGLPIVLPEYIASREAGEDFMHALKSGPVVIELTTDLPGMAVLRIPMSMTMNGEWREGSCG